MDKVRLITRITLNSEKEKIMGFRDNARYWTVNDGGFGGGGDFGGGFETSFNDNFGGGDIMMPNFEDTGGGYFDTFFDSVVDNAGTGSELDVTGPVAPTGGGAVDLGINPDTGAARMDFSGMAPGSIDTTNPTNPGDLDFGPGAVYVDNSTNIRDILGPDPTPIDFSNPPIVESTPIDWTPLPVGGEILTPDQYTGAADNLVVNTGPYADTGVVDDTGFSDFVSPSFPSVDDDFTPTFPVIPEPEIPEIDIVDTRPPVIPEPEIPEIDIVDTRPPVVPVVPDPEIPEIEIVDTRPPVVPVVPDPEIPEIEIVDTRPPKPPVVPEPEIPEIEIVDTRPPKPPVVPEPEIPEIEIVDTRPEPPVIPDPPVIVPPDIIETPTCPAPEMMILLANSMEVSAGDLVVGEMVRTQHEHTLEWGAYEVIHKEIIPNVARLKIKFQDREFVGSYDHKFSVEKDVWVKASDVKVGDVLSGSTVTDIENAESGPVVMLTIEDAHTYISQGLLSHNKSPLPPDDPEDPYVPPYVPPIIVEPPYVPPVIVEPPYVPPVPPVTPRPDTGGMLNPGWIPLAATTPYYQTTSPNQSQFYWGSHPFMRNISDLENYNNIPNAPQQPWGAATSAVGGTQYLDINSFLNSMYGTRLPAQPSPTYSPATRYQYPTAARPWSNVNPNVGQVPTLAQSRTGMAALSPTDTTTPVGVDPNTVLNYWNNPAPTTPTTVVR
jgi:hypothetical protein